MSGEINIRPVLRARLESQSFAALLELFLARHPYLAGFAASPTSAIVGGKIGSYQLGSRFQQVVEWRISA